MHKVKEKLNRLPDLDLLRNTIQGFYDIGVNSAHSLKNMKGEKAMQVVAPSVVNMTFAAELSIKCLYWLLNKAPVKGHSLTDLFYKLPVNWRHQIEDMYNKRLKAEKEAKDLMSFRVVFSPTNTSEIKDVDTDDLKAFLKLHDRSFENWRYLYENAQTGNIFRVDFQNLNSFIVAMIETLNTIKIVYK